MGAKLKLMQKRAAVYDKMKDIHASAKKENRDLTDEETKSFNDLDKEYEDLSEEIRKLDTRDEETKLRVANLEKKERELSSVSPPISGRSNLENPSIGMEEKDLRNYSILKAIRAASEHNWAGAELEKEASDAVAKKTGSNARSFYIPYDVLMEKRDLTTATGAGAIGTELKVGSFIDLLNNKMIVRALGATVLSGLVGNVDIPKKTGKSTSYWVGEGGSPQKSNASLGQVSLVLKTVAAFTELTRRFMAQTSIAAENFVRNDLASELALAIDLASIAGTGADNQPLGIINQTGVGLVSIGANGGPISWDTIVDLETEVAINNADLGNLAYLTNTRVRGACKKIEKVASTAKFLWEAGKLNDYNAAVSNQVPSNLDKGTSVGTCSAMIFGNWADLLIGLWGGLDILVNPYALDDSGGVRVTAFQDCDIQPRHAESFAVSKDITTAA